VSRQLSLDNLIIIWSNKMKDKKNEMIIKCLDVVKGQLAVFDIELSLSNVLEIAIREALVESELTYATL
jgi:hypothetical protein